MIDALLPEPDVPEATLLAREQEATDGIDPRCIPQRMPHPILIGEAIPYPDYTDEEHDIWRTLFNRQMAFMPNRVAQEYMDAIALMGMSADRIPGLGQLHHVLERTTGWQVARSPGLLHEEDFFTLLSKRIWPSTDYIRTREELDYTPAPDLFHDIFGHMPLITQPAFADFYQLFGQVSLKATGSDRMSLTRLYWFTVEFGLIQKPEGLRIVGAGIISSKEEVQHALSDAVVHHPFDAFKVADQPYDIWHLQPELFVLESFDQLVEGFKAWAQSRGLLD